ncbi:MAG: hypothetical protein AB1543_06155 [Candidatus Bipolaricaulota bacterium]
MRRVYIVWRNQLFHESVRLLLRHPSVALVGGTSDQASSQAQVTALEPDVVIVEKAEAGGLSNGETLAILRRGPKVIFLSLDDNEMSIYQRQHSTVASAEDLLRLILENPVGDAR